MSERFSKTCVWAFLLLTVSCATVPEQAVEIRAGEILLLNRHNTECRLYLDGEYFRTVPRLTRWALDGLPIEPFQLDAECGDLPITGQRVDPAQRPEVVLGQPGAPIEDRSATLLLLNPTEFDWEVRLNDKRLGHVFAGGTSVFPHVPAGESTFVFRELQLGGDWSHTLLLPEAKVTQWQIQPPVGELSVSNDSAERIRVKVPRKNPRELEPGAVVKFDRLPVGPVTLRIRFVDSGRKLRLQQQVVSGALRTVKLSGKTGDLVLENRLEEAGTLYLRDRKITRIDRGKSHRIPGVRVGKVEARFVSDSGLEFAHLFSIRARGTQSWVLKKQGAQLVVTNRTGEPIEVFMDQNRLLSMKPKQTSRLEVEPGRHRLSASIESTHHVIDRDIVVAGGALVEVDFGPLSGRLRIVNATQKRVQVFRNGNPMTSIDPGHTIEYAAQPLGTSVIEALDENRKLVYRGNVEILSGARNTATLRIALKRTPLEVENRTGEPVAVGRNVSGTDAPIPPGKTMALELLGEVDLAKFRGTRTKTRYDMPVGAHLEPPVELVLRTPSGGIVVTNRTSGPVEILLDQKRWSILKAQERKVQTELGLGQHILVAKQEGKEIQRRSFRVARESWFSWVVAGASAALRILNSTKEPLVLMRDGAQSGILAPGTETLIENLAPVPLEFSAMGQGSGHRYRLAYTPNSGETRQWILKPTQGGIRFRGLKGKASQVQVNDEPKRSVDSERNSASIAVPPGEQRYRIYLNNGDVIAGLVSVEPGLFTTVTVAGDSPRIECRNRTDGVLRLYVDGQAAGVIEAGSTLLLELPSAGIHTVQARKHDASRQWWLKDVNFPEGSRYGWNLQE